jgi:hypothetical protein
MRIHASVSRALKRPHDTGHRRAPHAPQMGQLFQREWNRRPILRDLAVLRASSSSEPLCSACYGGGDVKKDLSLAPEAVVRTSGVHFQSRECASGCADPSDDAAANEGDGGGAWRLLFRVSLFVRNRWDIEAVLFSRNCGNHPATWASRVHGFIRLSGGA